MTEGARDAEVRCRNCGALADDAYCPKCGQETLLRLPTLREFVREAAGRYVAFDGRLWRTVGSLVLRPGFLTREYLAGRRRRYIRPARLYLFATLIFFAVSRFYAEPGEFIDTGRDASKRSSLPGKAVNAPRSQDGPAGDRNAETTDPERLSLDDDFDVRLLPALAGAAPALQKRWERFNRLPRSEKMNQVLDGMLRYAPYAMFALLPAFALLLKLVYVGRRKRHPHRPRLYGEHMVFAAHNHALLFVVATAILVSPWRPVRFVLIAWILIYLFASMRAVYGGGWTGIGLRAIALSFAYSILFALATATLLVAAVLVR